MTSKTQSARKPGAPLDPSPLAAPPATIPVPEPVLIDYLIDHLLEHLFELDIAAEADEEWEADHA